MIDLGSAFRTAAFGCATTWTYHVNMLILADAALIVVPAIIHLRLWATGYSGIAVIGPLFLAQGVATIVFAVAFAALRGWRSWRRELR